MRAGVKLASVLTGTVLVVRELFGKDNFDRTLSFYQVAGPGYVIYKYTDLTTRSISPAEREEKFKELHKIWAPRALEKILELRGFYIKVGQMAASNIGNAFPDIWVRTMEILQNNVPHQDIEVVKGTIEKSFNKRMDEVFSSFDPIPLGAASIGQVHQAVLLPSYNHLLEKEEVDQSSTCWLQRIYSYLIWPMSKVSKNEKDEIYRRLENDKKGIRVVVKVQYPEVEGRFYDDVSCITNFCRIAQPEHVKALHEIQKQFRSEFDYRLEAGNLATVRQNLKNPFPSFQKTNCKIVVPAPMLELCTKLVLVMEDLSPCTKLADGLRAEEGKVARLRGMTVAELRAETLAKDAATLACGRPRRGLSAEEMDQLIGLLEVKVASQNFRATLFNNCIAWWLPGSVEMEMIDLREVAPLNHARVIDDLIQVHGHEVLVDGCFNGDPHPGNFLLVHSTRPNWQSPLLLSKTSTSFEQFEQRRCGEYTGGDRLGLIDYGQVKTLSLEARLKLARLIVALCTDDKERIADRLYDMGHRTVHNDKDNHYTMARLVYDSNEPSACGGRHIQHVLDELQAKDPIREVADEYVLVGRVCAMLRGLGYVLHQPRSTSEAWLPLARQLLVDNGEWDSEDEPLVEAFLKNRKLQRNNDAAQEKSLRLHILKP